MFDDVTSAVVHTALTGLSRRQSVIADNIANVETPGFLARRVMFEENLRAAVEQGQGPVTPTTARSLEPTRENGNNVNLDHEVLSNVDTGLRYQLMLRAMDERYSLLRTSMRSNA